MTGDVVVRGGAGGTVATIEHLRAGAGLLRAAADHLDRAAAHATWAQRDGLGPAPASPLTLARAQAELGPVVLGCASLRARADDVRSIAARLSRAADALDRAEDTAGTVVRLLLATSGHVAGERPVVPLLTAAVLVRVTVPVVVLAGAVVHVSGRRPALPPPSTTDPAEVVVQGLAGAVRGLAPGAGLPSPRPVVGAARLATDATAVAGVVVPGLRRRPLRVTARLGVRRPGVPAPRGAADVLARVGGLYPRSGGTAGTVAVDRLDHPDGTRSWVVSIPGTQRASSFGSDANPMDMATNLRLMASAADDGTELVRRALHQAGAGADEPVLLAGHSQGGMVAMALAGSATFTARHRVAAVLTAGSPVATGPAPAGTAVLHLEHAQDLVPALDGWRNPDQPRRTTAVRDLAASPLAVDRLAARSPGDAHGVAAYVRTARAVTALDDASVRDWRRAASAVLGGPGTAVAHHEFTGERAPLTGDRVPGPRGSSAGGSRPSPRRAAG